MLFKFIKYTQPSWFFNIIPSSPSFSSVYISEADWMHDKLYDEVDTNYESDAARYMDKCYERWHQGYMYTNTIDEVMGKQQLTIPISDEYRFIKKYWGSQWVWLTAIRRILAGNFFFKELAAAYQTRDITKTNQHQFFAYNQYETFKSNLLEANPKISVIIPTLNRYDYLYDAIKDLEQQSYKNFELIVIDQSESFNALFYQQFSIDIQVVHQKEKELWTARNKAIQLSKGDFLLFFDDDSRVDGDWIVQHLKCLDFFQADISAGVSIATIGGKVPFNYSFFRWADQFDSGNAMVKNEVFKQIGLFDLQFNKGSMGDAEFGLRAYTHGFKSISNPFAKRIHLKVASGGLREIGHWDGFRPKKWFAPKPVPSVLYLFHRYFPSNIAKHAAILGILLSNVGYKNKRRKGMLLWSIGMSIIKSPILFIQYKKSLNIAKQKLNEGPKINKLA